MSSPMHCRLAYLVTPQSELLAMLGQEDADAHDVCPPIAVISPLRHYEEAFEGWKRAWQAKAKQDYMADFLETWGDHFPAFTALLRQENNFDRWWILVEIDVIEIDSAWYPS